MADFRVIIDVKNVSGSDADSLKMNLEEVYGEAFDIGLGDFKVTVQQKVGENFYGRDEGDDDIET